MKIPNVDGNYSTKDGRVKIKVTRKDIEFEISGGSGVHIIDDDTPREIRRSSQSSSSKEDSLRKIGKGLNNLNFILTGKEE